MEKIMRLFTVLVFAAFATTAYAAESDVYTCQKSKEGFSDIYEKVTTLNCGNFQSGNSRKVVPNGAGQMVVVNEPLYYIAKCEADNICQTNVAKAQAVYVGAGAEGFYHVPTGYYLGPATDGSTVAYRSGIGPGFEGEQYNPAAISKTSNVTYKLYCGPQSDTCSYSTPDGKKLTLTREELPKYIPLYKGTIGDAANYDNSNSDGGLCELESCTDAQNNVIGLNPRFIDYRNQ
jgi:hypothetical protein